MENWGLWRLIQSPDVPILDILNNMGSTQKTIRVVSPASYNVDVTPNDPTNYKNSADLSVRGVLKIKVAFQQRSLTSISERRFTTPQHTHLAKLKMI